MVCMDFLAFLTKTRSNAVQLEFDEIDAVSARILFVLK
jgi:hypothetical protein